MNEDSVTKLLANSVAMIARQLSEALDKSIAIGGTEPKIIQRFITSVSKIKTTPHFKIESVFVHQKPYAFFVKPSKICGKIKTELGDILLITKRILNGNVFDHRFSFLQAKKLFRVSTPIEVHQFKFYRDISQNSFIFGNSVYPADSGPITWTSITKSAWFGNYLFLRSRFSTCAQASLIDIQYPGGCKRFPFTHPQEYPCLKRIIPYSEIHGILGFEQFLLSFLKIRGIGVNVNSKTSDFLDIILKRVGWMLDPPEETDGYFEDDKRGFLIIRITIKDKNED